MDLLTLKVRFHELLLKTIDEMKEAGTLQLGQFTRDIASFHAYTQYMFEEGERALHRFGTYTGRESEMGYPLQANVELSLDRLDVIGLHNTLKGRLLDPNTRITDIKVPEPTEDNRHVPDEDLLEPEHLEDYE